VGYQGRSPCLVSVTESGASGLTSFIVKIRYMG
jgi:hypothetical protein